MRVITKFTGTLLVGICAILGASAALNYRREVEYFEHDMRLDHAIVGDAIAAMVRTTWRHDGAAAARQVPAQVGGSERHLQLTTIAPGEPEWNALAAATRNRLTARETVITRAGGFQRTLVPVLGPRGESLALVVQETLADEERFSRGSWSRAAVVTMVLGALCTALAAATSWLLIDRPIRRLCAAARAIGGGDFDTPVVAPGGNEFGLLAGEIDAMRESLRTAKATVAAETERRIATLEQLRHADRLATVGRLAAGVAHELGTPLNVVGETAKLIRRGELIGGDLAAGAAAIAEQSQRMTAIIRQLLDFARPRTAVKERTEVAALIDRTLRLLETVANKRGVALRRLGGEGVAIDLDPAQTQQVLTNLVVNGIQASPPDSSVEVTAAVVAATPPPDAGAAARTWLRFEVRDRGTGIGADDQRRLFEPFFTTKAVGEGTGLGLSVSRGIVREHGGWIEVTSAPGEGTCFAIFLPAAEAGDGDP